MKTGNVFAFLSLLLLGGCYNNAHTYDTAAGSDSLPEVDTISPVPDTPAAGDQWHEDGCHPHDSADVICYMYACDCPNWVRFDRPAFDTSHPKYDDLKYSYYIEPGGDNDTLNKIRISGMRVMLYGRIDTVRRYPKNAKFIDHDPPKGMVFVYCGYRILDFGVE